MKVGDIVRTKGLFAGLEGVVTEVVVGTTVEDHGFIEISISKVTNTKRYKPPYYDAGTLEHFAYYDWEKCLEIIDV